MAFDGNEGGEIAIDKAQPMIRKYQTANPDAIKARFFGTNTLKLILDQEGCMGIRAYYATDADGNAQLILVGADADEEDMLDVVLDMSIPCPNCCSKPNSLNS